MPKYDLSTYGAILSASDLASTHAGNDPNQNGYNAAWLHGYARALTEVAQQLRHQQTLIDTVLNYLGDHHDSSELYQMLHEDMEMTNDDISFLGFDLPQCYETEIPNQLPTTGLGSNIREWYMSTYPTDDLCPEIKEALTFSDVVNSLNRNEDIYQTLRIPDSVIRERIFEELTQILDIDYDVIYNKWLLDREAPDIPLKAGEKKAALDDRINSAALRSSSSETNMEVKENPLGREI